MASIYIHKHNNNNQEVLQSQALRECISIILGIHMRIWTWSWTQVSGWDNELVKNFPLVSVLIFCILVADWLMELVIVKLWALALANMVLSLTFPTWSINSQTYSWPIWSPWQILGQDSHCNHTGHHTNTTRKLFKGENLKFLLSDSSELWRGGDP